MSENTGKAIGERVSWVSSNTRKIGIIVAGVPVGKRPIDFGYDKLDNSGMPRDHLSYLVRGGAQGGKQNTLYWPRTSLLEGVDGLTADEIAWCHANAPVIRALKAGRKTIS